MAKKIIKKEQKKVKTSKKKVILQSVKGMRDILPEDQIFWDKIRETVDELACYYNFLRIETPIVEQAELLERTVGEVTEIVEKQMFYLKSVDRVVLRPEGTAAVARAYIEHGLSHLPQPARLYYVGPFFRHEQPQEGRLRQFHQAGFEILGGESDAIYDAQVILVAYRLLEQLKITKINVQINSIGCRSCRPIFKKKLVEYYRSKQNVCRDCARRVKVNPFRALDCKSEKCEKIVEGAPNILDSLCSPCSAHFKLVLEYLEELQIPYGLNQHLVRGLDYYNRTVFEMKAEDYDSSLLGGGRYDYLVEELGGRKTPAVGVAIGLERLIDLIKKRNISYPLKCKSRVFFIHVGDLAKKKSLAIIEQLRKSHVEMKEALGKDSLKAQLRQADKEGASVALIFGQREAFEETIIVRDLETGQQETVPLEKFISVIKKKF